MINSRIIIAFACILGVLIACAQYMPIVEREVFKDVLPPEPCDYEPTEVFEVVYLPREDVVELCDTESCTIMPSRTVILPNTYHSDYMISIMRRHEYGHLNCPAWEHNS